MITFRQAGIGDESLLRTFLYHAIYVPDGYELPAADIVFTEKLLYILCYILLSKHLIILSKFSDSQSAMCQFVAKNFTLQYYPPRTSSLYK